jgi:transcriptional regulator with GAF, ATPase, and Fis domain
MTVKPAFEGERLLARFACELARQPDVASTSRQTVELVRSLHGCDSVALWSLERGDQIRLQAGTDMGQAEHTAEIVNRVQAGLEWDCLHRASPAPVEDLRREARWPEYRNALLKSAASSLSLMAFALAGQGDDVSTLVFAAARAEHFSDEDRTLAAILADHAALALRAAVAQEKAANLQLALASNRRIGIAIGVIMALYRCTDEQAFATLRSASQRSHQKLREVAEEVILTGLVPETATRLSA